MQINISNDLKGIMIKEYAVALELMRESESAREKLYYYSAVVGAVRRTFNIEFDSSLVMIHVILQYCYDTVSATEARVTSGQETVIIPPDDYFPKLETQLEQLKTAINENKDFIEILKDITLIIYSVTGNGFYLSKKGILKI